MQDPLTLARWRLVLGQVAEAHGISCTGQVDAQRIEQLVGFLFESGEGQDRNKRNSADRSGGLGPSP